MLGVLMLRGAQTPGELKQRTERMQGFADLAAVQDALDRLVERDLVLRLARRPGQKEERYMHRLSEDAEGAPPVESTPEPLVAAPPRPARAPTTAARSGSRPSSPSCAARSRSCASSWRSCARSSALDELTSLCDVNSSTSARRIASATYSRRFVTCSHVKRRKR